MVNFSPSLIIGVGETGAFFTLRETYLHESMLEGEVHREVRSFHHFNLSQDAAEAYAKAVEYGEHVGLPVLTREETLSFELREVKRATAEEMEIRARVEAAWKAEREEREAERRALLIAKIAEGLVPFGQWKGYRIADQGAGWLTWAARNESEDPVMSALREYVRTNHADQILPECDPDLHTGVVGKRQTFTAQVVRAFGFDSFYGWQNITIMREVSTGACLFVKSGTFGAEVGDLLTFKGTVKEHGHYDGQAQTVLQRLKVLED